MTKRTKSQYGSGNVFADAGVPNPDEHLTKADLVAKIIAVIAERGLTQVQAAGIIGIPQPKVSLLVRGLFGDFSTDRLCRILNRLGVTVSLVLSREPEWRSGTTGVHDQDREAGDLSRAVDEPESTVARLRR